jgi:molybdopterin/thiamine biosynthesis adenylyltransferase
MESFPVHKTHHFIGISEAEEFLRSGAEYLDLFPRMWKEWFALDKIPAPSPADTELAFEQEWGDLPILRRGVLAYYPHLQKVISLLPQPEFVALRTSRNRYKITPQEQEILATKRVGIVGLSVGRSVAVTLAMERSCGMLRVADFDTLDLSNLNRIKAPITDLGKAKTLSLAEELALIDPYFHLECADEGITRDNLHDFLTVGGKIDVLIDECDSLALKVLLRLEARKLGIPVLMDTSDRGMIDIERYDLHPEYPIFHNRLGNFEPPAHWEPSPEELKQLFSAIVDISSVSERGKYSLSQIGTTITTWPQLASSVTLGAGAAADICRKILLNHTTTSGRYYIDTDEIII